MSHFACKLTSIHWRISFRLRYHPDRNRGCTQASERFQLIKDAFEDIQARQEADRVSRAFRSKHRGTSYSTRYRYTNTTSHSGAGSGSRFQGFRRDGGAYSDFKTGYQDEKYRREPRRNTSHETLRAMRSRLRQTERAGLGFGVLFAGTTLCASMLVMDYAWRVRNRGKSFDDLMKSLDKKPSDAQKSRTKRRGPPTVD